MIYVIIYLVLGLIWALASCLQLLLNGLEKSKLPPWYGYVVCFIFNLFVWPVTFIVTMFNGGLR